MGNSSDASWRAISILVAFLASVILGVGQARRASAESNASQRRSDITFREVAAPTGISTDPTLTFGSAVLDHDLDRDPDFFVNRHWMGAWFYLNRRGTYVKYRDDFKHTKQMDRHGCAWGEANGDGRPDLFCTQGANHGTGRGPNQLWLQTLTGFRSSAKSFGVASPFDRARSVNWIDYDSDGDLDLFVTNAMRDGYPNRMFRNDRGSFSAVNVGLSHEIYADWPTSTWADWDDDGDPDVLSLVGPHDRSRAFVNTGGRFQEVQLEGITAARDGRGWVAADWGDIDGDRRPDLSLVSRVGLVVLANRLAGFEEVMDVQLKSGRMSRWVDVDNDGDLDLFVVQGSMRGPSEGVPNYPDLLFLNEGGSFRLRGGAGLAGPSTGNGDSVAASDFDLDGRLDLFVTNGHSPSAWRGVTSLLRNTSRAGNWSRLRLDAGRHNPFGVGVKVRVRTNDLLYWREVNDGVSYRAQTDVSWLHLGLGHSSTAKLLVRWPGGSKDCLRVRAGRIRVIERGQRPCHPS